MSVQSNDDRYALGRSAAEERRLRHQAALVEPGTRRLFAAAGISAGMKVLDLGSGAGDVAMLVAQIVGPSGSVVGVDVNPTILETVRRRACAAGHANITFYAGDIRTVPLEDDFDAVVGRLILGHLREPVAALRAVLTHLRSTGVAAYEEWE